MKKSTLLSAFTTVAYCFCATILIIWVAIIIAFSMGYYSPKVVYAEDIFIDTMEDNPDIQVINGYPVMSVSSAPSGEDKKNTFIIKASSAPKEDENGDITNQDEVTVTNIKLSSSNPNVATVPRQAHANEPIEITITKDENGNNRGGFCFINVENEQGLYMQTPLVVFVDIPVTSLEMVMSGFKTSEDKEGNIVYSIFEDETGSVSTNFLPALSKDPTHLDENSKFNSFRRTPKKVEYYLSKDSPTDVIEFDQAGNIKALKAGIVTLMSKTYCTYSDIDFVENYEPEVPEQGHYIPPELLEGRFVETSAVIEIKEITLDAIHIDDRLIRLPLFDTKSFSIQDLGINFVASNGNDAYFDNMYDKIVLTSNAKGLKIAKKDDLWYFTLEQENEQLSVLISLPNYESLRVELTNFEIIQKTIGKLVFEGDEKSSEISEYNDVKSIYIHKENDKVDSVSTWDWTSSVSIIPTEGNTDTSYFLTKVFATGVFHNDGFQEAIYVNEQGKDIIQLGKFYEDFGCEVLGGDFKNPNIVQALARGNIMLRAYVIKTDIFGNPIDADGNIIADTPTEEVEGAMDGETALQNYVSVAESNSITFKIIEKLSNLNAYVTQESDQSEVLVSRQEATNESKILVVNSQSEHTVKLTSNSEGALFDAFNNKVKVDDGYEGFVQNSWIRVKNDKPELYVPTLVDDYANSQNYYLNLKINNINATKECNEIWIQFEYYTGSSAYADGYETIATIRMFIIDVPVESITMNVNAMPSETIQDIKCFWVKGLLECQYVSQDGVQKVDKIKSRWGLTDTSDTLTDIAISKPSFKAAEIEALKNLKPQDYVIPKKLVITNQSYSYKIMDGVGEKSKESNAAYLMDVNIDNEPFKKIMFRQLNKEVYLKVYSHYGTNKGLNICDVICLKASLAENIVLKWNTDSINHDHTTSANINELYNDVGYKLRANSLFGLELSVSENVKGLEVNSDSRFIQFEIADDSLQKVKFKDAMTSDELIFNTQPTSELDVNINVVLVTEDGLKVKQTYTIHFAE